MPWMYILECNDGTYYVGSTTSLNSRIYQHQQGLGAVYTSRRLPVELVYCEEYPTISKAFAREKQVQGWCRKKRETLIQREYHRLPELSKKGFMKNKKEKDK